MAIPGVNRFDKFAYSTMNKIVNILPSVTINNKKVTDSIKWAGQHISSPQNRLILGVSALMSQPFIDLHNRKVDEGTRKVSAARTVAKIIAGTATGFFVRYYCIKAINAFTKNPINLKPNEAYKSFLYPKKILHISQKGLKHYKMALGTFISLGVMMFTNFAIDAPLTKFLTNKFVAKIKENDSQNAKGVNNA